MWFASNRRKLTRMKRILTLTLVLATVISYAQTRKNGDFHLDQAYKIDANGTIYLTCSDAKVFITGSNRTDVNVKVDRQVESKGFIFGESEFNVDVTEDGGNLTVRERSHSSVSMVGYYHESYEINIQAPKGVSLRIRGDDGDYFIRTIDGTIEADLDDADVELTACGGNDFRFRLDDGDIKMDQGKGSLEVDADDADVYIRDAKFSRISADIDDGDFVVETSLDDSGDYFIDAQDGMISLTILGGGGRFDIRHDDASVRADDSFSEVETSEDRSRFTLSNGNAKVDIRADDARVKLAKR